MDNIETIRNMTMPKTTEKPREFWIDSVGDTVDGEFDAIVCDKEPPHIAIHVIEYSAFEKLKAENERLMRERDSYAGYAKLNDELMEERDALKAENERLKSKLSIADLKTHKEKTLRILALLNECDTLKAKLAEVEAENERLRNNETGCQADYANLERELTREREAAKVMREALCSIEGGDARDEKEAGEIARTAIAKADEIRGGE